ncbi:MAG: ammonium transporter [Oscillatoria sp. SIO1A7]|nr:ammonium transporter [Oscillatoria sp. SIO1A7]
MRGKKSKRLLRPKKSWLSPSWQACLFLAGTIVLVWSSVALAAEADLSNSELKTILDTIWVIFAACLVFFMNAGFAMLETGFCRQKNAVNILAKNLIVFGLSTVAYWALGFGLMFSNGAGGVSLWGTQGFLFSGRESDYQDIFTSLDWSAVPLNAKFFFQLAFAGTAATIVSGAVAERIKFKAFLIFSFLLVAICYPIAGHWVWGGGWLSELGFYDFAGSTVVHSMGGWAALIGCALLGPRLGRYIGGKIKMMPAHNLGISTLGGLILWLGWFGFNPGSTMAADPKPIAHIILTTNMAAATGAIAATFTSWLRFKKPDLSMIINGVLAGLVGITASCAYVNLGSAVIIGSIAGIIVVFSVDVFNRAEIDDPVGATSVHLVCGIWGTLAVGLFSQGPGELYAEGSGPAQGFLVGGGLEGLNQLFVQLLGIGSVGAFAVLFSAIVWSAIKATVSIRVSKEEEEMGLDLSEHGIGAYEGFMLEEDN